jgi:oligoendopeptidase F
MPKSVPSDFLVNANLFRNWLNMSLHEVVRPIRESSKSTSKTVAKNAEQQRRRELETGFHNIRETRQQRIRYLRDVIDEYLSQVCRHLHHARRIFRKEGWNPILN